MMADINDILSDLINLTKLNKITWTKHNPKNYSVSHNDIKIVLDDSFIIIDDDANKGNQNLMDELKSAIFHATRINKLDNALSKYSKFRKGLK